MPVQTVRTGWVVGRQVETAAEPPDFRTRSRVRDEEADIAMSGGCIRIARMKHQGQSHRLEGRAGDFGSQVRGRRRNFLAEDMRDGHACALEHRAVAQDAALAPAALAPNPTIPPKSPRIDFLDGRSDAVL